MARDGKEDKESDLINSAIHEGIEMITSHHPRVRGYIETLAGNLDKKVLRNRIREIYGNAEKKSGLSQEEKLRYLQDEIADYIATGAAFNETGKEILLGSSLREDGGGLLKKIFSRGQKDDLDKIFNASRTIYESVRSGDYAQRMPEIAEAVTIVDNMNFLDPVLHNLERYGGVDKKEVSRMRKNLERTARTHYQKALEGIDYHTRGQAYQRAAAFLFGVAGIVSLFYSNSGITGNVIGNLSTSRGMMGIFLIAIALVLFAFSFIRKNSPR